MTDRLIIQRSYRVGFRRRCALWDPIYSPVTERDKQNSRTISMSRSRCSFFDITRKRSCGTADTGHGWTCESVSVHTCTRVEKQGRTTEHGRLAPDRAYTFTYANTRKEKTRENAGERERGRKRMRKRDGLGWHAADSAKQHDPWNQTEPGTHVRT